MKYIAVMYLFLNLKTIFTSDSKLSDSFCQYKDEELNCFGDISNSNEFQLFHNVIKKNYTITRLCLENIYLTRSDLDQFKNLSALKIISGSAYEINETIFSVNLGSTLKELALEGNYTFSSSPFQHLAELSSLSFVFNYQLSLYLNKVFFSQSLSKLSSLSITHSGISEFSGDMFVNLINLKTLTIFVNPLTEFPTAIQHIPSLKKLEIGYNDIEIMKRPFETILYNLESLELSHMEKLKSIDNCAFCSFPNLKTVLLGNNENLTWIHENSFGALLPQDNRYGHKVESLEMFNIENCNISVLHESLLNWEKLKDVQLGNNKFICNCSIAWLIEDIQSINPIFSDNLKSFITNGQKSDLICYGPEELKAQRLQDLPTSSCKQLIEKESSKIIWFFFGFLMAFIIAVTVVILAFCKNVIYFNRNQRLITENFGLNEYNNF